MFFNFPSRLHHIAVYHQIISYEFSASVEWVPHEFSHLETCLPHTPPPSQNKTVQHLEFRHNSMISSTCHFPNHPFPINHLSFEFLAIPFCSSPKTSPIGQSKHTMNIDNMSMGSLSIILMPFNHNLQLNSHFARIKLVSMQNAVLFNRLISRKSFIIYHSSFRISYCPKRIFHCSSYGRWWSIEHYPISSSLPLSLSLFLSEPSQLNDYYPSNVNLNYSWNSICIPSSDVYLLLRMPALHCSRFRIQLH